ncbi:MAG: hypothetical protein U0401_23320 [Anaerolineae bacterium]
MDRYRQDLTFEIDDQPAPLTLNSYEFPPVLDLQAGVGVIRFEFTDLPADHRGSHRFFYQNNHLQASALMW